MSKPIDKDSLPLDKPRRTPGHPTKSHIVKTRVDGKEKIIRFGEQGASTAGKPKEGESEKMKAKRASFKARHAANIAKGKSSPAYWANKVKWAEGGAVRTERSPMTALGLLEQMRRAGANREPEFDPVNMTLRERRAAAPLIPAVRRGLPAPAPASVPAVAVAPAPVAAEIPARVLAREPVADVVPRGEAPPAVLAGIAARRALDPSSPTYFEDIQRINNEVLRQTLPGMTPQPVVPSIARRTDVPGYARGGLADLDHKYADGGEVVEFEIAPVVAAAPLADYQDGPGAGQMGRRAPRPVRRAPRQVSRPAPREEMTADQLNAMVLDTLASRYGLAQEAAGPASARERIRRVMGYAEGGEVRTPEEEEYDRRLLSRMKRDTGRTTEPTREEQMQALRTAGRSAVEGVADVMLPQSPLDLALMTAFGPGGRAARLAGTTALAALEPSEAEAGGLRRAANIFYRGVPRLHGNVGEVSGLHMRERGAALPSNPYLKANTRDYAWSSDNPAVASSYTHFGGAVIPLELIEPPGAVLNARGESWDRFFFDPNSPRPARGESPRLVPEFREALEDPNVKSILVNDILDYGMESQNRGFRNWLSNRVYGRPLDELSAVEDAELSRRGLMGNNLLIKNPSTVRYNLSGEPVEFSHGGLAELDQKYAEGGEVSVMTYDPAAVDALAKQIEAEYV